MTPAPNGEIDRREAVRRVAALLGGALSAPALAGVLAGCDTSRSATAGWTPRALAGDRAELVATIAEHILPETETPGARSAGVHRFIDTMLAEFYPAAERERFLAGLADVDARAQRTHGAPFLRCPPAQQRALLEVLDREAFAPATRAAPPFFRTMKELTLLGYYTSEPGATRELRHVRVPGRFDGCVPFAPGDRAWAV